MKKILSRWLINKFRRKPKGPDIYKILHKRSRNTRLISITLIFLLIISAVLIANMLVSWKDNQANWISQVYDAYHNPYSIKKGDLVFFRAGSGGAGKVGIYLGNTDSMDHQPKSATSAENEAGKAFDKEISTEDFIKRSFNLQFGLGGKTESEKIADSIATVLISLSLVLFVGFVMRAVLVFTRYYMQLAADFENQKIAYMLSKNDDKDFGKTLEDLRNNKINFEKTPSPPHDKIMIALIDVLKETKKDSSNPTAKD